MHFGFDNNLRDHGLVIMGLIIFLKKIRFTLNSAYRRCSHRWRTQTLPIDDFRNLFGTGFGVNDGHHLIDTLNFVHDKTSYSVCETPVFKFHNSFLPKTFFDVSGIKGTEKLPMFVYPWGTFTDGSSISSKNIRASRFLGPSDESLVISEVDAIIELCRSFEEKGFDPYAYPHSDINGTILVSADRSKRACVVMQGNHRVSVMAYLGIENIAVKPGVTCIDYVYETDVNSWPFVRDGVLSADTALAVFNFFLNGQKFGEVIDKR